MFTCYPESQQKISEQFLIHFKMHVRAESAGANQPLRIVTSSIPEPPSGHVRVKVAFSGVCATDIHITNTAEEICKKLGYEGLQSVIPGHEISGYIEKVGEDADLQEVGLKVGDPVMVLHAQGCGDCSICKAGYPDVCSNLHIGLHHGHGFGPINGGGFQTHVMVKPQSLVKVPAEIPMDVACMLPCSAGASYASLCKLQDALAFGKIVNNGKARLLIFGCGGLGLWTIKLARAIHGDKVQIIGTDIIPRKLKLAKERGADEVILWDESATDEENVAMATENGKVHGIIDFIGNSQTFKLAMGCLNTRGTLVYLNGTDQFEHPIMEFVLRSLTVKGNATYSTKEFHEVLDIIINHNLTYTDFQYVKLEEASEVFEKLKAGQIDGRAIIKYD